MVVMDMQPTPDQDKADTDLRAADVAYCRLVLLRLIEVGGEAIETVHKQAQRQAARAEYARDSDPKVAAVADATVAIERMGRTIRRSMAMLLRLHEPAKAETPRGGRVAARRSVMRAVEDVIGRDADSADDDDALRCELYERMDAPELDGEIAERGAEAIVAELCRDLGVGWMPGTPPCRRRTPDDVVALWARAGQGTCGTIQGSAGAERRSAADDG